MRRSVIVSSRIRVLWLIKGLGAGGAEMLLTSVARVRDRDRFHYEAAYVVPDKTTLAERLQRDGVPVHCLNSTSVVRPGWAVRLRRLVRQRDIDIVHTHSPLVAGAARVALRLTSKRPRIVYTEHNVWNSYARATRMLNAATYRLDDAQFAVSDAVRTSIAPGCRRHVSTVTHGVPVEDLRRLSLTRAQMRKQLGVKDHEVVICTIANLRRDKAYHDLLTAARTVLDSCAHARFVAVGQGPLEREIKKLHRELGLGERFAFLGYHPNPAEIASASDVFALASRYEGFPIAVLEALAVGLPVVATTVGGIPVAVSHGKEGLLVPPEDPNRLADALLTIANDERLRRDMARAAASRGQDFDISAAAKTIESVYEALMAAQR